MGNWSRRHRRLSAIFVICLPRRAGRVAVVASGGVSICWHRWMRRMVQRALQRGEETSLAHRLIKGEIFTPQLLAEEAARGDRVAIHVYSEVGRWLGADRK